MRSSLAYASLSAHPVHARACRVGDTSWLEKWAQWTGTPLGVKLPNRRMGGEDRWQFESQLFMDVCVTTCRFCWSWRPDGREEGSACDGATGETGFLQSPHCAVRLLHAGNLLTSCFSSLFRDLWHTCTCLYTRICKYCTCTTTQKRITGLTLLPLIYCYMVCVL